MKKKKKIVVTFGMLILITTVLLLITKSITKHTGYSITTSDTKTDFEKCIDEQNLNLYINTANSVKTLRKIELRDYLQYSNIVNCQNNNQLCIERKINNFPTWIINENKIQRDISFPDLIKFSGCVYS